MAKVHGQASVDFKIVLLGQHAVGKTCLIERFLHSRYEDNMSMTVGACFDAKTVDIEGGKSIVLGIWDTAGAERFANMTKLYYRGYDPLSRSSFEKLESWVKEVSTNEPSCNIVIVCNKSDIDDSSETPHLVGKSEAIEYAKSINAPIFFTSAKNGDNVYNLFSSIASILNQRIVKDFSSASSVKLAARSRRRAGCC